MSDQIKLNANANQNKKNTRTRQKRKRYMYVAEMRYIYNVYAEPSGQLPIDSLDDCIRIWGANPTNALLLDIHEKLVANGKASHLEFVDVLRIFREIEHGTKSSPGLSSAKEIVNGIRMIFDKQDTGKIPISHLKFILQSFGEQLSNEEWNQLCNQIDLVDNNVDYKKFVNKLVRFSGEHSHYNYEKRLAEIDEYLSETTL